MRKLGFTVAEIIITMAIIGIVSALSMPTFISSYRKQSYANTLATAISNFETAMSTMLVKEGVDDLLDTQAWGNAEFSLLGEVEAAEGENQDDVNAENNEKIKRFMFDIGRTLKIIDLGENILYKALSTPNAVANLSFGTPVSFLSKGGVEYKIEISNIDRGLAKSENDMLTQNCNYINKAADVGIDINGAKGPNILGRDYFRFELGTDGHLYPFGGRDYCIYNEEDYQDVTEKCVADLDGNYCAAYLMQNGYKMDY